MNVAFQSAAHLLLIQRV